MGGWRGRRDHRRIHLRKTCPRGVGGRVDDCLKWMDLLVVGFELLGVVIEV